eukprot:jgi/Mesvir1/3185/Mv16341-RA.2
MAPCHCSFVMADGDAHCHSYRPWRTQIIGTICGITSGLAVGPEGPMVHIGAAVASTSMSSWRWRRKPGHEELVREGCNAARGGGAGSGTGGAPFARIKRTPSRDFGPRAATPASQQPKSGSSDAGPTMPGAQAQPQTQPQPQTQTPAPSGGAPVTPPRTSSGNWAPPSNTPGGQGQGQTGSLSRTVSYSGIGLPMTPSPVHFDFHNDVDRRDFVTAGSAAGLAAAFGTPIGGVLFSLEEASSYWSKKVTWRSLLCAVSASFVLSMARLGGEMQLGVPGLLSFRGLKPQYFLKELPLQACVAAAAGLLGALFNIFHAWMGRVRADKRRGLHRLLEVLAVTAFSVTLIFFVALIFGECRPRPDEWAGDPLAEIEPYGFRFTCAVVGGGKVPLYNDLATLFFSPPEMTIKQILAMPSADEEHLHFSVPSLGIFLSCYLVLMVLACGVAVPGGLFMPSIMIGTTCGSAMGILFASLLPSWHLQPGVFALVGATAMLGGVFRSSISLVVIMVEGTGGIDFLYAIILAIMVSNWVAAHVHHAGVYESDLDRDGNTPFIPSEPTRWMYRLRAKDIMAPHVVKLMQVETVANLITVLRSGGHNGFPVIERTSRGGHGGGGGGKLVGLILRSQLLVLLQRRAFTLSAPVSTTRSLRLAQEAHEARLRGDKVMFVAISAAAAQAELFERDLDYEMRAFHHVNNPNRRYMSSLPLVIDELKLDWVLGPEIGNPPPTTSLPLPTITSAAVASTMQAKGWHPQQQRQQQTSPPQQPQQQPALQPLPLLLPPVQSSPAPPQQQQAASRTPSPPPQRPQFQQHHAHSHLTPQLGRAASWAPGVVAHSPAGSAPPPPAQLWMGGASDESVQQQGPVGEIFVHPATTNAGPVSSSSGGVPSSEAGVAPPPPLTVDLGPYMHKAPCVVYPETSVIRIHMLFRALGVRHVIVIDHSNRPVGIITRKDLAFYEHGDASHMPRAPPSPTRASGIAEPLLNKRTRTDSFSRRKVLYDALP